VTARDRRALRLGATVVLASVVALRVLPWSVQRLRASVREVRERTALLVRAKAELADAVFLQDSASVLTRAVAGLAPKLLSGDTPAEAFADLAGRLNLAASRNQAKLERTDQLPDSEAIGRLRRVRVRASLQSDIRGVTGLLNALERGEAALSVEDLRIVASDPTGNDGVPEILRAEVTVGGWFLQALEKGQGKVHT
jgi:hypothetical protein